MSQDMREQLAEILPQVPKTQSARPENPKSDDSVRSTLSQDTLTHKTPVGDLKVELNEAQKTAFINNALDYQKAVIRERCYAVFQSVAMAALTGLSAVAVGVTLYQNTRANKAGNA